MVTTESASRFAFLRGRRGAFLRWSALCLGLIMIGWSAGYLLMPRTPVAEQINIPKEAFEAAAARADMPSVVGLDRNAAGAAISDAGISGVKIEYLEQPAAGPPGTVVGQKPASGNLVSGEIELTLSIPADMPDLTGVPHRDARTKLEDLGAIVAVEQVVDPEVPAGAVLRTVPEKGRTMPRTVTMVVAEAGDALSLSTVSSVSSSNCSSSSSSSVNGQTLSNNVTCRPGSSKTGRIEYAVNRHATLLEAVIGTDDRQGTGGATVTVFADDRPVKTVKVGLGTSEDVKVDLRKALRLRIEVTTAGGDDSPTVVLGDARLRGSTQGLDQIAGRR
ncbi:MAG: PASTA domain-containing protein [Gordonia sp. (in: high G+C Gram-positive bacteria)]|uniref:PASTA domain-containing protein n=1 Tax=Gordonia sp. (in: high G+C Gram-positive bacteria) TaxID=84139 RepID=UPI0039E645CB